MPKETSQSMCSRPSGTACQVRLGWHNPFLRAAALIFAITAAVKLLGGALGAEGLLRENDPLFGLRFVSLIQIAAVLELGVALVCLLRPVIEGLVAVAWLSADVLAYRIGLWWTGWQKPCACLGNLTDALHISPQVADNVMKGLLAFMLIGSVSLLVAHHRQSRAVGSAPASPVTEQEQA